MIFLISDIQIAKIMKNKNKKDNDFGLFFSLNNNENRENGGEIQIENGQTNNNNIPNSSNSSNNTNNKNQDIFAFFQ